MKKAISILLAITLLSVLAACSNADDSTPQAEIETPSSSVSDETPSPTPSQESDEVALETTPEPIDPRKIYFFDTYNEIEANPQIMYGDLNWEGWEDTAQSLTQEADSWYSFTMPSTSITSNYNMIIFFNGLPDNDPNCIQWVWSINDGLPNGNIFIADNRNPINPSESFFKGVQRNASSFATKENALASLSSTPTDNAPAVNLTYSPEDRIIVEYTNVVSEEVDLGKALVSVIGYEIFYDAADNQCLMINLEVTNQTDSDLNTGWDIWKTAYQNGVEMRSYEAVSARTIWANKITDTPTIRPGATTNRVHFLAGVLENLEDDIELVVGVVGGSDEATIRISIAS